MSKIIHIYSSSEEIEEIFGEGLRSLDRALELFMMIEKQDTASKLMVKRTYELIRLGEDVQEGLTVDELLDE